MALTRAKRMPMMAETQNMRRKSPRETNSTIPGLAVLVACFRMVLGGRRRGREKERERERD